MNEARSTLGKFFWFIGILSFVFAIICFCLPSYEMALNVPLGSVSNQYYGGDAYTGIQNATAQTANNTLHLYKNITNLTLCIKIIGGFAFIIIAFLFVSLGVFNLSAFKKESAKYSTNNDTDTIQKGFKTEENRNYTNDTQYKCPQCGTLVKYGISDCPNCHQIFTWIQ